MKQTFFTPGPSQLYPTVDRHIKIALKNNFFSISHRSEWFQKIFREAVNELKILLTIPENYHIFFISSGTEAMERTIQNIVEKNSFHFVNGSFSTKWYEIAKELGKNVIKEEVDFGKGFLSTDPSIPKN